jgi:hypothetical protein
MYIIRRLAEYPEFQKLFFNMDIFGIVFSILTGTNRGEESIAKVNRELMYLCRE